MKKPHTLMFLINSDKEILLGQKKHGHGKGYWNGFGGKLEVGETIEQAAIRETHEESGVLVALEDMSLRAILRFHREGQPEKSYDGIVYIAPYDGQSFHETEEMIPKKWAIKDIPYHLMREADIYWIPHVLHGKYVDCTITFDQNNALIDYALQVEDTLFFDIASE